MNGRFIVLGYDDFGFGFDSVNTMNMVVPGCGGPVGLCICGVAGYGFDLIDIFCAFMSVVIIVKNKGLFFHTACYNIE